MASVWVIGDIHGEITKLDTLLNALPRGEDDYTIFLGDYIDRGPSSAEVVRRVLAEHDRAPTRTILLWGNHEDMAASNFRTLSPTGIPYDPYDWFRNGGLVAMESWGYKTPQMFAVKCPPDLRRLLGLLRLFFRGAETGIAAMEPYLFVHAGLLPGREPEDTLGETLLWVREEFLDSYDPSGRIVVHGHTPFAQVRVLADKIGIDTAAFRGGPLTALCLPERVLFQTNDEGGVTISDLPTFPTGAV